jgi:four helix bundle protein
MARFLRIALGSLAELETQIELAIRLGYLDQDASVVSSIAPLRGGIKGLHNTVLGVRD